MFATVRTYGDSRSRDISLYREAQVMHIMIKVDTELADDCNLLNHSLQLRWLHQTACLKQAPRL